MTADEIRPLVKRDKNFRPFRVFLTDGRTFDIKDPRLVLAAGDEFMIARPWAARPNSGIGDGWEAILAWDEIAKVEFLESVASA